MVVALCCVALAIVTGILFCMSRACARPSTKVMLWGWHMPHGLICSAFYHVCCFSIMPLPHVSSALAAGIHVPLFLLLLLTGITVIVMTTCTFI